MIFQEFFITREDSRLQDMLSNRGKRRASCRASFGTGEGQEILVE